MLSEAGVNPDVCPDVPDNLDTSDEQQAGTEEVFCLQVKELYRGVQHSTILHFIALCISLSYTTLL